jgi:hypothetical protein
MSGANQAGLVERQVYHTFMQSIGVARDTYEAAYEDIVAAIIESDSEGEEPAGGN